MTSSHLHSSLELSVLRGAETQTAQASEDRFRSPSLALLHFLLGNLSVFSSQGSSCLFVLFPKMFVFKALLAIFKLIFFSFSVPYSLSLSLFSTFK